MTTSNKQFLHYQGIAKQSLDKFRRMAQSKQTDKVYSLLEGDWQAFVDDEKRLQRYIDHVEGVAGIFGFSRELSDKLSYVELTSKVAERFAEVDLAEHIIRELGLPKTGGRLEKIIEGPDKKCDFKYLGNPTRFFEAKYTHNLSVNKLTIVTKDALDQIKHSIDIDNDGIGCVWIFTYMQPDDPMGFQQDVMKIKDSFPDIGFDFKLNVQVYSRGLYGDATVI